MIAFQYLIYCIWPLLYFFNSYKFTDKINRNILSFSHSVSCASLAAVSVNTQQYEYFQYPLYYLSMTYFVWDTMYIIYKNIKNKKMDEIPFIYHHLVCLLALNQLYNNINLLEITKIFYYGEGSNFFNYIVYHLIKTKSSLKSIALFKTLQIIWFGYFRVYFFSLMLYNTFNLINNRLLAYNLAVIYLMGLIWGINQFKSLLITYKNLIFLKENKNKIS